MKDLSSNNLVGKVEKNPKWTAGKLKGALEFTDGKLFASNFVILIMIGGLTSAIFLSIQSGATWWLQANYMDSRIRPSKQMDYGLWAIFFLSWRW